MMISVALDKVAAAGANCPTYKSALTSTREGAHCRTARASNERAFCGTDMVVWVPIPVPSIMILISEPTWRYGQDN